MSLNRKIGIVGGGKMGEAIIAGLLRAGKIRKQDIIVSDVNGNTRERLEKHYGIRSTSNNADVVLESDVIILCVQPRDMAHALESIRNSISSEKLLISIAAGVTTDFIQRVLGKKQDLVRAMPNNPCTIGEGMIVITLAKDTSERRMEEAFEVFSSVGRTLTLEEHLFDAVTGLSGSGPAYAYLFIEALADGGVKMGIPKSTAVTLAAQTVLGAAKMVLETEEHPAKLRDLVTTPGGTTVQGLCELEEGKLRASCSRAVERATQRAKELTV